MVSECCKRLQSGFSGFWRSFKALQGVSEGFLGSLGSNDATYTDVCVLCRFLDIYKNYIFA